MAFRGQDFFCFVTSQTVCLASQMTLLGFIFHRERERNLYEKFLPPYAAAGIRTHVSRTCTTIRGTIQDRFTD